MLYTPGKAGSRYFLDDEDVTIAFMTDELAARKNCFSLPVDLVIGIQVLPKSRTLLSDVRIDESKFITFDPSTPAGIGYKAYVNDKDGVFICTHEGKVNEIGYYGEARDRQICPTLNPDPKRACNILIGFVNTEDQRKKEKSD